MRFLWPKMFQNRRRLRLCPDPTESLLHSTDPSLDLGEAMGKRNKGREKETESKSTPVPVSTWMGDRRSYTQVL